MSAESPSNATQHTRRRWRLRFGLRSLAVLVAVIAVVCGWVASRVHAGLRQREAVAALRELGCLVCYEYQNEPPEARFGDTPVIPDRVDAPIGWFARWFGTDYQQGVSCVRVYAGLNRDQLDAAIQYLAQLKGVKKLVIAGECSDEHLAIVAGLTDLNALLIVGGEFTDTGLEKLQRLKKIESIFFYSCANFRGTGLTWLAHTDSLLEFSLRDCPVSATELFRALGKCPSLGFVAVRGATLDERSAMELSRSRSIVSLKMEDIQFGAGAVAAIASLSSVSEISLSDSRFADMELVGFANLTRLRELNLERTNISDAGVAHLASLEKLEHLSLNGTRISNSGLRHFRHNRSLEWLDVSDTVVDIEGVKTLTESWLRVVVFNHPGEETLEIRKLRNAIPRLIVIQRPPQLPGAKTAGQ